jgi:hypothetical protein
MIHRLIEHRFALLLCLTVVLLASVTSVTSVASARTADDVDHRNFDEVLKRHVTGAGLVDYGSLYKNHTQLDAYAQSLSMVDLKSLDESERLATLINAYNAFTIQLIIDHYPLRSIKDIPEAERWKAVRFNLGGKMVSLDQIEHEMIRGKFDEPRIHFALVCASIGCPPLRGEPYTGVGLESQLDDQMKLTHRNGSMWISFDPSTQTLTLTKLYEWFKQDFLKKAPSVEEFVAQYTPEVKQALDAKQPIKLAYSDYNWGLNDTNRR